MSSATKTQGTATSVGTSPGAVKGKQKGDLSATGCCHEAHQGQSVCEDKVRERAYLKWEAAGCPCSDGVSFWLEAESELSK